MLYNLYVQNDRSIMFSKHVSLWNTYLTLLRPLGLWLSFLTCRSVLSLQKVWTWELGSLIHGGYRQLSKSSNGLKAVPLPSSTLALNFTAHCCPPGSKRELSPARTRTLRPICFHSWQLFLGWSPLKFLPLKVRKNVREIHDSIYNQLSIVFRVTQYS